MGYHITEIKKGVLGTFSKIQEEFEELQDAVTQQSPILILVELSDLVGAIEAVASKYNITLEEVIKMTNATKKAFKDGTRV